MILLKAPTNFLEPQKPSDTKAAVTFVILSLVTCNPFIWLTHAVKTVKVKAHMFFNRPQPSLKN